MSTTIKVKPLVWISAEATDHWGWHYHNAYHSGKPVAYIVQTVTEYVMTPIHGTSTRHPTLEAAQRAAQEEWEAFVLAALEDEEPPSSPAAFDCGHLRALSFESIHPKEDGGVQCTVCANHMRGFPH